MSRWIDMEVLNVYNVSGRGTTPYIATANREIYRSGATIAIEGPGVVTLLGRDLVDAMRAAMEIPLGSTEGKTLRENLANDEARRQVVDALSAEWGRNHRVQVEIDENNDPVGPVSVDGLFVSSVIADYDRH